MILRIALFFVLLYFDLLNLPCHALTTLGSWTRPRRLLRKTAGSTSKGANNRAATGPTASVSSASASKNNNKVISLQDPHERESPADVLRRLAGFCDDHGIDLWDVYGDFDLYSNNNNNDDDDDHDHDTKPERHDSGSFLRDFEAQVAADLGKQDAVFMPSGVMAQAIALLIHQDNKRKGGASGANAEYFICHETSHLLLHEQQSYQKLLHMKPIIVSTEPNNHCQDKQSAHDDDDDDDDTVNENENATDKFNKQSSINSSSGFPRIPPMGFADVLQTLTNLQWSESLVSQNVAALLVELPHRELGGKITLYSDLQRMAEYCAARKIAMHCDGARLFEAAAAYNEDKLSTAELCSLFDSVYISFYKGLGGMSGAMLCGTKQFCKQARVWLRRFGGNLYTLLPLYVSAYEGYQRNYKDLLPSAEQFNGDTTPDGQLVDAILSSKQAKEQRESETVPDDENDGECWEDEAPRRNVRLSFGQQRHKLREIVAQLSRPDSMIPRLVSFDPQVPETNMVHGYLKCTAEEGMEWCGWITQATGVQVLRRIKPLTDESNPAWQAGYRSFFEWTMGNANGQIPVDVFYEGWTALAETYVANHVALENGENPIEYNDAEDDDGDADEETNETEGDSQSGDLMEEPADYKYELGRL